VTEARKLTLDEISGVAFAGLRAVAMTGTLDDLAQVAESIKEAAAALDAAIETANSAEREKGTTIPEDHKVLDAAKAYGEAEQKWLLTLEGYLTFAQEFDYSNLLFSTAEQDDLIKALFPNA
jgi:predicted RNase H-like HicB family nuclease